MQLLELLNSSVAVQVISWSPTGSSFPSKVAVPSKELVAAVNAQPSLVVASNSVPATV